MNRLRNSDISGNALNSKFRRGFLRDKISNLLKESKKFIKSPKYLDR